MRTELEHIIEQERINPLDGVLWLLFVVVGVIVVVDVEFTWRGGHNIMLISTCTRREQAVLTVKQFMWVRLGRLRSISQLVCERDATRHIAMLSVATKVDVLAVGAR